jgi:hypothetical protein
MLAHLTSTPPHYPNAPAKSTPPPFLGTAPLVRRARDVIAGHAYVLPAVRELRRPLDATFDPRTW